MTHFKIIPRTPINNLDFQEFPPVLSQVLTRRSLQDKSELIHELSKLANPSSLKDIDKASERIVQALLQQEKILIIGDFDTDGATSIALCIRVLGKLGAKNLAYLVPNRFEDGYGLTPHLLDRLTEKPDLIITVDNGIASVEGVDKANNLDMDVIITDHHLPQAQLPNAYAIINPNQQGDQFPSKSLAGVGVSFYLLLAIRSKLRSIEYPLDVNMAHYLDLVALGTVADVVALDHNNRILVSQGLNRIRKQQTCAGILALAELSKKEITQLTTIDIGFALAPKLNAAGRLDDMSLGIECLLSDDITQARNLAAQLTALNLERRDIEQSMLNDAEKILAKLHLDEKDLPLGLCIFSKDFHQGVIGIIASRLKEKFSRPVFVFAEDKDEMIKGSGRSISNIHMKDILEEIAAKNPLMIDKFGGHAMAAGLNMHSSQLENFKQTFNEILVKKLSKDQIGNTILTDDNLDNNAFNIETAECLKFKLPWGQAFAEPIFEDTFKVIDIKILKDLHIKFKLQHDKLAFPIDAIGFFQAQYWTGNREQSTNIHCAFKLDINLWQGEKNLQLLITGFNII